MTCCVCQMAARPGSRCAPWWVSCRCAPQPSSRSGSVTASRTDGALFERLQRMPELRESIHATGPGHFGVAERGIIGLVNQSRLRRILTRMLDENEFLSPYGIRSLSRYHADHPYVFSRAARNIAWAICRRNRKPACLAATPTGGGRSGCRSTR